MSSSFHDAATLGDEKELSRKGGEIIGTEERGPQVVFWISGSSKQKASAGDTWQRKKEPTASLYHLSHGQRESVG
jgi:hypothetical protein